MNNGADNTLDFPGRKAVTLNEIAAALRVTPDHIFNLVEDGSLQAINLNRKAGSRQLLRVPIDEFRRFIACRLSTRCRLRVLELLSTAELSELLTDVKTELKRRTA